MAAEWNEINPGVKARVTKEWCDAHRERRRASARKYRNAHREKTAQASKAWRIANPGAQYELTKAWRKRNPERARQQAKEWQQRNLPKAARYASVRRAKRKKATPPWVDMVAIQAKYDEAARLTRDTGIIHEVDHIVPLQHRLVCGLHVPANLRAIPRADNKRKSNKFEVLSC